MASFPKGRNCSKIIDVRFGIISERKELRNIIDVRFDIVPERKELLNVIDVRFGIVPKRKEILNVTDVRFGIVPERKEILKVIDVKFANYQYYYVVWKTMHVQSTTGIVRKKACIKTVICTKKIDIFNLCKANEAITACYI